MDQRKGKDVYLQGSRQMDSLSRQYYERSLGAGMFVSPETENGIVGYSEPFRRFVQHEGFTPQVNEIANTMPSWIPGEDHLINFQKGDPYVKVDEGYARLPGAGYEALHPELEGVDPEDYPDITKLSILGDVAPYSREYNRIRAIVEKQAHGDPDLRAHYEQIVEQVRQTKESTLQVDQRRFDAPVDQIEGTVKSASFKGVELNEYPGDQTRSLPRRTTYNSPAPARGPRSPPSLSLLRDPSLLSFPGRTYPRRIQTPPPHDLRPPGTQVPETRLSQPLPLPTVHHPSFPPPRKALSSPGQGPLFAPQ